MDQRFISWLEGALEDPIAHTEDALSALSGTDSELNDRLNLWMLSQGWELSSQSEQRRQNLGRASRLSCYILLTRLVFYQVLRRRFRRMSPLTTYGIDTSEHLREILDARFEEAVQYSHDYETVFVPDEDDFGYAIPFLSPTAPGDWARLIQRIEEFDFSSLDFDVIGQLYERLISSGERRRFGQFYTSPDVVDLINAFCIRNPRRPSARPRMWRRHVLGKGILPQADSRPVLPAGHCYLTNGCLSDIFGSRHWRVPGPAIHNKPRRPSP